MREVCFALLYFLTMGRAGRIAVRSGGHFHFIKDVCLGGYEDRKCPSEGIYDLLLVYVRKNHLQRKFTSKRLSECCILAG